jgi:hypothetical protein
VRGGTVRWLARRPRVRLAIERDGRRAPGQTGSVMTAGTAIAE